MTEAQWHVAVLIPARDEEKLLPKCLRSVLDAAAGLPSSVSFDVVVVVDSSTDATQEIAERLLDRHGVVVTTNVAVVGSSRSLAAQTALTRYSGPLSKCWLANTDADCSVPRTWLIDQIAVAAQNVEAVAGTVDVDSFEEYGPGMIERFRKTYVIHPDDSHPNIHGAKVLLQLFPQHADASFRAISAPAKPRGARPARLPLVITDIFPMDRLREPTF